MLQNVIRVEMLPVWLERERGKKWKMAVGPAIFFKQDNRLITLFNCRHILLFMKKDEWFRRWSQEPIAVMIPKSGSVSLVKLFPGPDNKRSLPNYIWKLLRTSDFVFPSPFLLLNVNIYNYYPMPLLLYFWTDNLISEFQRSTNKDKLCFRMDYTQSLIPVLYLLFR